MAMTDDQQRERERAINIIARENTRDGLVRFARRLKDHPYLADLSEACYEKCIAEGMLHGNYTRLPKPTQEDSERVNLYKLWLYAVVITNTCSLPTITSVKSGGYVKAMLKQIDNLDDIGTSGFQRLKSHDAIEYSAEYLMRKYYSDRLRDDQKIAIDCLLEKNGIINL